MTTNQELSFCPFCFASSKDGSWDHVAIAGHCTNCGVSNGTVVLPAWAVDRIRESASWVGKRYYPDKEDHEARSERQALLALVNVFPGRSVRPLEDSTYDVSQRLADGRRVSTLVRASSAEEAMRKSGLRYVPESNGESK